MNMDEQTATEYNIYCDESCHLEHDRQPIMVIGGVWCPKNRVKENSERIRDLKNKYNSRGELKWVKVSESRQDYFLELVDYFFTTPYLNFRCIVVDNKSKLDHKYFNQGSHDSFYYKMYFYMLRHILKSEYRYNIYLDIKDTRSAQKLVKLKEVLCNNVNDFTQQMIRNLQNIHSHESEVLQLADLLIGAISYHNRNLSDNITKKKVIERIMQYTGQDLRHSSPPWVNKFNLFIFSPSEINDN
jgi:predicted nucleic acid-binding protein